MTVKIRNASKKIVAEGDDRAEAMVRLKDANKGALVYPHVDGHEVHLRVKDKNGEYPDVQVLKIEETD